MPAKCYCITCKQMLNATEFYKSYRLDKYPPDGRMTECKKCLTRHVNNYEPDTFLWILKELDVPYVEQKWATEVQRNCTDPSKVNGTSVLGPYLRTMKLRQWNTYRWDDTERIKAEMEAEKAAAMALKGISEEEIQEELESARYLPENPFPTISFAETEDVDVEPIPASNSADNFSIDTFEPIDFEDDLTDEDRKYLSLKWGRNYKPYEWIQLEQFEQEMLNSFDIQTPSHKDYLKLICKTSLKAHQLIDLGDIEGFQKVSRTYDSLMKSAGFTAIQNKSENGEFVNSFSELVLLCEKDGFIPRFYTDKPQDKVDETLADMRNYTRSLITEEQNLGNLIENAVKALQKEADKEEDEDVDDDELTDDDFNEYYKFLDKEREGED